MKNCITPGLRILTFLLSLLLNLCLQAAPQHIAIILPFTGVYAAQSQAIFHGISEAYYAQTSNTRPSLEIFDSNQQTISKIIDQFEANHIDAVIGPLGKKEVEDLADANLSLPVIALNYLPADENTPASFYQFGLSPEDDLNAILMLMSHTESQQIMIISLESQWWKNLTEQFVQSFTSSEKNRVISTLWLNNQTDIDKMISSALNIDKSQARAKSLQQIIKQKIQFTPHRRQDIDAIFLNMPSATAKQIVPLLRFYYAGNIPTYATSMIYDGNTNVQQNRDLDGLFFVDMPWAIAPNANTQNLQAFFSQTWPRHYPAFNKFYALGIDAYSLLFHLEDLNTGDYPGNTGLLHLKNHRQIQRKLSLATFKEGLAKLIAAMK